MKKVQFIRPPRPVKQESTKACERIKERSSWGGFHHPPTSGVVVASDSTFGSVDIQALDGRIFKTVPVVPPYWTGFATASAGSRTGGRDLPPIGALVVILFVDGSLDKPLVIGSYPNYYEDWQASTLGVAGKENEKVTYFESGWKKTFLSDTGDWRFESDPAGANPIVLDFSPANNLVSLAIGQTHILLTPDKVSIKNATSGLSVGSLMDSLFQILAGIKTVGSATNQVLSPDVITSLQNLKLQFDQLWGA